LNRLYQLIRDNSHPLYPIPTGISPVIIPQRNIKAVIFDIYGTLFISGSGDIANLSEREDFLHKALKNSGFSIPLPDSKLLSVKDFKKAVEHYHEESKGRGSFYPEVEVVGLWKTILKNWKDLGLIRGKLTEKRIKSFICIYEAISNPVWPMPGLPDLLQWLSDKVFLGIISNAQFYTPLLFPAFFENKTPSDLGFLSELTVFSYEEGVAKPDLLLFEKLKNTLLKGYNILPENTLFIGNDMKNDIYPAQCIGIKTGLFAGDKRSLRLYTDNDILKACVPSVTITSLSQLKSILL